MLTLTTGAAEVLADARTRNGLGNDMTLRISAGSSSNGRAAAYQLHFTPAPRPDDVVVATDGIRLFVAADAVDSLTGAVLDAEDAEDGRKLVLKRRR